MRGIISQNKLGYIIAVLAVQMGLLFHINTADVGRRGGFLFKGKTLAQGCQIRCYSYWNVVETAST